MNALGTTATIFAPVSGPLLKVDRQSLSSQVRPALVLSEREAREVLAAAARDDVSTGGRMSAGPAGVSLYSAGFDGPHGTRGSAVLLGKVDWTYDTPARHYITVYRAMVTPAGLDHGETTSTVLGRVLGLIGLPVDKDRVTLAVPPRRDPFRRA